jgi:hypothetical protein
MLQHVPALLKVLGVVIARPHLIPLGMGKLTLDNVRSESLLIEEGTGISPQAMDC